MVRAAPRAHVAACRGLARARRAWPSWASTPRGGRDRDLLLGLPLYLAEALRFATEAAAVALTAPVASRGRRPAGPCARCLDPRDDVDDGDRRHATAPPPGGAPRGDGPRRGAVAAEDGPALAEALADLPRRVTDAVRSTGVPGTWAPVYAPPAPAEALRYVHAHRACLELGDDALYPPADGRPRDRVGPPDDRAGRCWGRSPTSPSEAHGAFPALLYFGGARGRARRTGRTCRSSTGCRRTRSAWRRPTRGTPVPALGAGAATPGRRADRRAPDRGPSQETGDRAVAEWLARAEAVR